MTKVSSAMVVIGGLVGPKPRAKAVGDGQPVNIPALSWSLDGVTLSKVTSVEWRLDVLPV